MITSKIEVISKSRNKVVSLGGESEYLLSYVVYTLVEYDFTDRFAFLTTTLKKLFLAVLGIDFLFLVLRFIGEVYTFFEFRHLLVKTVNLASFAMKDIIWSL